MLARSSDASHMRCTQRLRGTARRRRSWLRRRGHAAACAPGFARRSAAAAGGTPGMPQKHRPPIHPPSCRGGGWTSIAQANSPPGTYRAAQAAELLGMPRSGTCERGCGSKAEPYPTCQQHARQAAWQRRPAVCLARFQRIAGQQQAWHAARRCRPAARPAMQLGGSAQQHAWHAFGAAQANSMSSQATRTAQSSTTAGPLRCGSVAARTSSVGAVAAAAAALALSGALRDAADTPVVLLPAALVQLRGLWVGRRRAVGVCAPAESVICAPFCQLRPHS